MNADRRQTSRENWTSLIEGEVVVLLGKDRVYAKMFHSEIDARGPMRMDRDLCRGAGRFSQSVAVTAVTARIKRLDRPTAVLRYDLMLTEEIGRKAASHKRSQHERVC